MQQLYVDLLKNLPPKRMEIILMEADAPRMTLGVREKFLIDFANWQTRVNPTSQSQSQSSSSTNILSPSSETLSAPPLTATNVETKSEQATPTIETQHNPNSPNLATVLKNSVDAQTIVDYYNNHCRLNANIHAALIECIAYYFAAKGRGSLTTKGAESIAEQIISTFNGERLDYYVVNVKTSGGTASTTGLLLTKYYNRLKALKNRGLDSHYELSKATKRKRRTKNTNHFTPMETGENEVQCRDNLIHQQLTEEEVCENWAGCFNMRYNDIRNDSLSPKVVYDLWPQYKQKLGYRLVRVIPI